MAQSIPFAKVEAIGNSFVLIDAINLPPMDWPLLAKRMSAHHFGVGSDGILVLVHGRNGANIRMRMFNPDGTEDACGNGLRCSAAYAHIMGLIDNNEMIFETRDGLHRTTVVESNGNSATIRANMGQPSFCPHDMPAYLGEADLIDYPLHIGGHEYKINCVKMGTPHAVIFTPKDFFWETIPPVSGEMEVYPAFPERTSITWCAATSSDQLFIRTWERAVGPTLGCGTGACSALVAAHMKGFVGSAANVTSPGGTLHIEWPDRRDVIMSGPARIVFQAEWELSADEIIKEKLCVR